MKKTMIRAGHKYQKTQVFFYRIICNINNKHCKGFRKMHEDNVKFFAIYKKHYLDTR